MHATIKWNWRAINAPARISASSRATRRLLLISETIEAAVEVLVAVADVAVTAEAEDVDDDEADDVMALLINAAVAAAFL